MSRISCARKKLSSESQSLSLYNILSKKMLSKVSLSKFCASLPHRAYLDFPTALDR